jgi:hypothetical protein
MLWSGQMRTRENVVEWLLGGDPAIRWQALRDLAGAPPEVVAGERARVAREGWGAAILALQQPNGQFGRGDDPGWMQTVRALTLLKDVGADPADPLVQTAIERVRPLRFAWHDNRSFFEGETEACLNGRILGVGGYFGVRVEALVERLVTDQLSDGGWNCDAPPSVHASIHSTICVLEGLLACERSGRYGATVRSTRLKGEAYLLERRLMRGLHSGQVIDGRILRVGFPPGWEYDVLRALDYFRAAGHRPDPRMAEAIDTVRARAHQNGLWPLNRIGADPGPFAPETTIGGPSRWNTLRALRVLDWYEGRPAGALEVA